MNLIRVATRSRSASVAGAIAGTVRIHGRAEVRAIGVSAVNQSVKAAAIARKYLALDGMGLAHTMKGNLNDAVKYFEQCLTANPSLTDAHNHLGSVYQQLGMLDKAEERFLSAISDGTYHSRELPLYNLARLYYLQEKNDLAMEYTNRAIMVNRRMAMAFNPPECW